MDKILWRSAPFTLPEEDGWVYGQVRFTLAVRQAASWVRDARLRERYPWLSEVLAGQGDLFWIVRWRSSGEKAGPQNQMPEVQVVYSRQLGSGV